MRPFAIVVAADAQRGIGKGNGLPWRLPGEMAYFKRLTSEARPGTQNAVIMGRKTYESIAPKFRPLANRLNVVLSREPNLKIPGTLTCPSLEAALDALDARTEVDRQFVIGGASVYAEALRHPRCREVFLTRVHATFDCDAFLAPFEDSFELTRKTGPQEEAGVSYTFELYTRRNS